MSAARRILQVVLTMGFWIALLFLGARRIGWERGWISLAASLVGSSATFIVMRLANPELIAERSKIRRKDTKGFDKVFMAIFLPLSMAEPFVGGWDAGCATCSSWPDWLVYPGVALYFAGTALIAWTMAVNRHAETTVRIQTDREHKVVSHGPYAYVRHPMYVGILVSYLAFPLIWGSRWAMALSIAVDILFIWRTAMEDRTLRRELDGYEAFTHQTPYRLIPGVW